jgi:single-strand DNA-binding protein
MAVDVGFGDNKKTHWLDVAKFGKGSEGLARILKKGSAIAVSGQLGTREHNGKTYLQCRAEEITLLGGGQGGGQQSGGARQQERAPAHDDLSDDIPF